LAASIVVGTKGVLSQGNTATKNIVLILVTPTVIVIKYYYPYAILALLTALMLFLITAAAFSNIIFRISRFARLCLYL
jgi:hypothetical protein